VSSAQQDEEVLGKAYDGRLMRRLLHYVKPYKWQVAFATLTALLHSFTQVVGPYLNQVAIDRYLFPSRAGGANSLLGRHLAPDATHGITQIGVIYIAMLLLGFVLDFAQTYSMQWVGQQSMYQLRRELFHHLQRLQLSFFDHNPVGRLVTRVTNDVEALNEMIANALVAFFDDSFVLVLIIVIMVRFNWKLSLITLAMLPLIAVATALFRRAVRDSYRRIRVALARINSFLQEHVSGMSVVQVFNREQRAYEEFQAINRVHLDAWSDAIFAHAVYYPVIEILATLAVALILWYGGLKVMHGTLSLGIVVATIQYAQRFFRPIQDLGEKYNTLQSAMASSERIFKLLDTPITLQSPAQPHSLPVGLGRIEFDHVWFAYRDQDWILKDVSFTVAAGSTCAIVGHTGAGKTTLISLLLRFYDVQRGRIMIDGVDIRTLELTELRRRFGVVLQDPYLFTGTIASNIRLSDPALPDVDVARAAEEVNLADFVDRLPERYDTPLRERGTSLSTGQKQLVSFARALAANPPFLILDEATSSVDTETELHIRDALHKLTTGRTGIIIAHRLSTIQRADVILVMHKGVVRERGSHQQLLQQRGIYWKLYRLQYKDQELSLESAPQPAM